LPNPQDWKNPSAKILQGWDMKVEKIPFSELLSNVVDNRGKTCPTADTGIPLIATNCIRNELLYPTYDKVRYVSQETYDTWFRGHPKPGDIIFVNKATPGRVCLVPDPVDFCIAQDMVAVRADEKKVLPKFLFALLRSPAVQARIEQMHVGTLIPHFKKGDFDKLLLAIPERETQEFIGDLYFELSAKIDANRRLNETLESLAQILFKKWFVDAAATKLPKGWTNRALYDCATYINGAAFRNEHFSPARQGLPVIKIGELKDGVTAQTKFSESEREPKYRIASGDILFSWSGSPDTSIDIFVWSGGDGWLNQHIFKIEFKRPIEKFFVYYLLRHLKPEFIEIARNKQTTGLGHVTAQDLKRMTTAFPPDEVLEKFNEVVKPLFQKVFSNLCESQTLAELRDALLPKLLSGEMDFSKKKAVRS
jgi:type I restriction enzyme, S subunit